MKRKLENKSLNKKRVGKTLRPGKGQAAMEFLMTYGWAIMIAILALGVLATMGAFDKSNFSSEKVVMDSPFYGVGAEAKVYENTPGALDLEVINTRGEKYIVTKVEVSGCGAISGSREVESGERTVFTIPCESVPSFGGKSAGGVSEGYISITYNMIGYDIPLVESGKYVIRTRKGIAGSGDGDFVSAGLSIASLPVLIISGLAIFLIIRVNVNKSKMKVVKGEIR